MYSKYKFFIYWLIIVFIPMLYAEKVRPNILFVIADDLMKQVEVYGYNKIKTPELSKLAKDALVFDRAYCQYPLCGPSRASLMISKYPDVSGITWNQAGKSSTVQKKAKEMGIKTLPAYFKSHGYITVGVGKLYHNSVIPGSDDTQEDFSVAFFNSGHDGIKKKIKEDGKIKKSTTIAEASDKGIYENKDGTVVKLAKEWLGLYTQTKQQKPFFMSIGIKKPHSPFSCPKQFWDLYQKESLELSQVKAPNDILQHYSLSKPTALLKVHSDTQMYDAYSLPKAKKFEMIHGYQACVSYADYLVGDLIRSLKKNGLYENTIIVFTSDHGYKLGEYDRWAKYTLHEKDSVVPFIVRAPQYKKSFNQKTKAIVGLIDLYPTLVELCGLPVPSNLDGRSFVKTLADPNVSERDYIRTVLPRSASEDHPRAAGVSIAHKNGYRYHHWWEGELDDFPTPNQIISYELYDHYKQNDSAISGENIYKKKPEILKDMRKIALQK